MNKIGIHFGYFNTDWNTDFIRQIEQIKRIGLDILEVAPAPFFALSKNKRDEIARAAKGNDITLTFSVGLGADQDLASEDETVRNRGIKFTLDTFKIMSEMGSNMYSGVDIGAWNQPFTTGVTDKSAVVKRSVNSVKEIMKAAETFGITFAVEVVNRYESSLVNTAKEAMAYVDMVDSPNCKILLDTYHMNIEEDSFADAIRLVGDRLGHFHVGESNRRPPKEDGRIPWDEITGALKEIHYQGAVVMEPFIKMGGEVGRDIKVWRDISENASAEEMEQLVKNAVAMLREKLS
ncbi:sugar phosphate isomerase/epimerase [Muricomes sp. OA1]|uniref:Sugar phosphate isomerase/epimerase n=1 Tax=Hungatella hathewayi TaxID=154046 RepID=A0A3E2WV05_9FIRM|nr:MULTISPECIES: sugar phosphate isomerase/epimerase family protein [Clostridia]MCH1972119.1 sugar phosphate isomerase/epimerase [Muricomes sp. OA1]MSC85610.1 TIM barrel protein [Eubacterium sp. BIOML-A1]MSD08065.1 TIM barrel protein [Eubacterium sp. BIOML-A2]RGC31304.1 sugar phosphate isomerase/epimerase [Hungatella hathewayi]RYT13212.1 sugar phosphate isomerase/epimerase [Eubacterium sp. am_0171]